MFSFEYIKVHKQESTLNIFQNKLVFLFKSNFSRNVFSRLIKKVSKIPDINKDFSKR